MAPLIVGGPAPVVISGHRAGEEEHGENMIDGGTAAVGPPAVGLAPLVSGHRTMDGRPLRGAQTQCVGSGEMRPEEKITRTN